MEKGKLIGGIQSKSSLSGRVASAATLSGTFGAGNIIGDKSYIYIQGTASAVWRVTHNLGKYPSVTVVDSADNVIVGEVQYISPNEIMISFVGAFSGKVYLN